MSGFVDKEKLQRYTNGIKEKFALKTDIVASDWSQNDSDENDYINNRTHWKGDEVVCAEFDIDDSGESEFEWNANIIAGHHYIVSVSGFDDTSLNTTIELFASYDVNSGVTVIYHPSKIMIASVEGTSGEYNGEASCDTTISQSETIHVKIVEYEYNELDEKFISTHNKRDIGSVINTGDGTLVSSNEDSSYGYRYVLDSDKYMAIITPYMNDMKKLFEAGFISHNDSTIVSQFGDNLNMEYLCFGLLQNNVIVYTPKIESLDSTGIFQDNEVAGFPRAVFLLSPDDLTIKEYYTFSFDTPGLYFLEYDDGYGDYFKVSEVEYATYNRLSPHYLPQSIDKIAIEDENGVKIPKFLLNNCPDFIKSQFGENFYVHFSPVSISNSYDDLDDLPNLPEIDSSGNETITGNLTLGGNSGVKLRSNNASLETSSDGGISWIPVGSGASTGVSYLKNVKNSGTAITLKYSEYTVVTVTDDFTLSLESENIASGDTIYEYNGELIFGNTVYSITWPLSITSIIGVSTFSANSSYIFSILNDTIIITQK